MLRSFHIQIQPPEQFADAMTDHELAEQYRATSYIVEAPGEAIAIRIGSASPALDALLDGMNATEWAFITAWNPGSMALPPAENERSNNDLRERIGRLGYETLPGAGEGDDGAWPAEKSFFIVGIPLREATELGRFYRQRAIVAGRRGGRAMLIWC
jgi:hypothetical protein